MAIKVICRNCKKENITSKVQYVICEDCQRTKRIMLKKLAQFIGLDKE